jgi:hypothetical protein
VLRSSKLRAQSRISRILVGERFLVLAAVQLEKMRYQFYPRGVRESLSSVSFMGKDAPGFGWHLNSPFGNNRRVTGVTIQAV